MDETLLERLVRKAEYHAEQAERYRVAADVVRGETQPSRSTAMTTRRTGEPRKSTMGMIQYSLGQSSDPVDLPTLTRLMQEAGWETTSATPSNTVRTALHRLMERGAVHRDDVGRFMMAPQDVHDDEPAAFEALDTQAGDEQ